MGLLGPHSFYKSYPCINTCRLPSTDITIPAMPHRPFKSLDAGDCRFNINLLNVLGMTLNCIHIFIVTGSFLYLCVMRQASQRFFIHSCICADVP